MKLGMAKGWPAGVGGCRETLEYVANTLIFILSGVIIAAKIYANSVGDADDIKPIDYGYAVLLWVYLLVRCLLALPLNF